MDGSYVGNSFIIRDLKNTADSIKLWTNGDSFIGVTTDGTSRNLGIGTDSPQKPLNVFAGAGTTELIRLSQRVAPSVQQEFGIGWCANNDHDWPGAQITALEYDASDPRRHLLFYTRESNADVAPIERLRIDSDGDLIHTANNKTLSLVATQNATNAGTKIAFFGANRYDTDEEFASIKGQLVNNQSGSGNKQRGNLLFTF